MTPYHFFYVYVLKSARFVNKFYIGFTGDLRKRLTQHNSRENTSTKRYAPWKLLYYEAFSDEHSARDRELSLKHNGNPMRELKKRIGLLPNRKSDKGFIALTSSLILSAILMLMVFTTGATSFYARADALGSEFKRISLGLSEACSNAALLKIAQNYTYDPGPGGEVVSVGPDLCRIVSVTYGPEDPATHRKLATIKTSAQYPPTNGSWSTTEVKVSVQNPTFSSIPPPVCSFAASPPPPTPINAGQSVSFGWNTNGTATSFTVVREYTAGGPMTIYSGAPTGGPITDFPTQSATYTATITGPGGSTQCVTPQSVTVNPSLAACADTLMMIAGAMNTGDLANEGIAATALLDLYGGVSPVPFTGVGSYGGLDGSAGWVPDGSIAPLFRKGWLTDVYGGSGSVTDTGAKFPTASVAPNQWTPPLDYAYGNDSAFVTDSTSGHQQGYNNFGLSVPVGATINGIEVVVDAKLSGAPPSQTTATLYPNGQGFYTAWTNGESKINETGIPSCTSADSVVTATTGNRESVVIDLSSVPIGATITSVDVTAYDKGDTVGGGTYKTSVRLNSVDLDAGADLAATATIGGGTCSSPKTQTIDVPDTVKSAGTILDVGVIKTVGNTNTVRVGAIRAVVNYTPALSGTVSVALSKNNGSTWLSGGKTTTSFNSTESAEMLGNNGDLWGQPWAAADFADGSFALRLTDTIGAGVTMMLNYVTVKVHYTVPVSGLYGTVDTIVSTINSSGGTDISAGIVAGSAELNSIRHQAGHAQVLILVSPSGNHSSDLVAAFPAADNAKSSGIQIFTINFGVGSANDDWAAIATDSDNDVGNGHDQAAADIENTDDDYFFISPTSDAMKDIFEAIGKKVCPALTPPPPPAPPPPPPPAPALDPITVGSWDEVLIVP
jgi:predicted GIY-YIG superfamily endonuclease